MTKKFVAIFEMVAAACLAFVTALTFISVFLRHLFNWPIPDSFDGGKLLLGMVVFWGIAAASHHDKHIQVDALAEAVAGPWRKLIKTFAITVTFVSMAVLAWMVFEKVGSTYVAGEQTFDLRLPVWPFHGFAWVGIFLAAIFLMRRLWRQLRGHDDKPKSTAFDAGYE